MSSTTCVLSSYDMSLTWMHKRHFVHRIVMAAVRGRARTSMPSFLYSARIDSNTASVNMRCSFSFAKLMHNWQRWQACNVWMCVCHMLRMHA